MCTTNVKNCIVQQRKNKVTILRHVTLNKILLLAAYASSYMFHQDRKNKREIKSEVVHHSHRDYLKKDLEYALLGGTFVIY